MRLLYFNPETEYALASGASFYTPPAVVEEMKHANQLLPRYWAEPGDIILVDDAGGVESQYEIVDWSMLQTLFSEHPDLTVEPWGWNKALAVKLASHGVPGANLPTMPTIDNIRRLAHRRTTIAANAAWNSLMESADDDFKVDLPVELFAEEDCRQFAARVPGCWFKAPWSSSGRGVINTGADMTETAVGEWCHGIIRRQGSVLAETPAEREADYATEWLLKEGKAEYIGLSHFKTSNRGKYLSNSELSQSMLEVFFNRTSRLDIYKVVEMQKKVLEDIFAGYSGPLGVDMILEKYGGLRPFVEINVRRTMGMVALDIQRRK